MVDIKLPAPGDKVLDASIDGENNVKVSFPFWVDPVSQQPFTLTYSPGTTMAFAMTQITAVLNGQVPPFIGA